MAQRVVLHVGLMKSGTSYVQQRLGANREVLRESGVLFPGRSWKDQVSAVVDLLQRRRNVGASASGRWAALVAETAAYDGVAVVSVEFLAPARTSVGRRVVESFGDTPVDVVLTLRDLGRGVPAMWQESLQNRGVVGWGDYVAALRTRGNDPIRGFWRKQGMARIAESWTGAVGAERLSLVTVPPPGAEPEALWARFCAAARIDGSGCAEIRPANTSLDAASALVLLDLNRRLLDDSLSEGDYHTLVKFGIAKRAMAGLRAGPPIGFEPPPWLRGRAARINARLAATGARVVGDLAELEPLTVPGVDPDTVDAQARLDAAVEVLRVLTLHRAAERRASRATSTSETGGGRYRSHGLVDADRVGVPDPLDLAEEP